MSKPSLILNKRPWGRLVTVKAEGYGGGDHTLLGALERVDESYWRWWPGRSSPPERCTDPRGRDFWPYGVWTWREALWRLKRVAVALWGGGAP